MLHFKGIPSSCLSYIFNWMGYTEWATACNGLFRKHTPVKNLKSTSLQSQNFPKNSTPFLKSIINSLTRNNVVDYLRHKLVVRLIVFYLWHGYFPVVYWLVRMGFLVSFLRVVLARSRRSGARVVRVDFRLHFSLTAQFCASVLEPNLQEGTKKQAS